MHYHNVKSTFDSIVFEWKNDVSLYENIHSFIQIFLSITDPNDKISTRVYEHTMRTIKIAEKIMSKELADRDVVIISLLLHDIGKTLCDSSHNLVSYRLTELLFEKIDIDKIKAKRILDCILYHSAKDVETLDLSNEQKVVMDADILDEVGLLLITKVCLRTQNKNISVHDMIKTIENKYSKIDKETSLLKTKYGLELYIQKKKKFRDNITQLKIESEQYKIK